MKTIILIIIMSTGLFSCISSIKDAVKETKYSAYELIGMEKRDLFKRQVKEANSDQKETSESFANALEKLKSIYGFDGGELERKYHSLENSYQSAERKTGEVHRSIAQVETVAKDLFTEWAAEIKQMQSENLKASSRARLSETQKKYNNFYTNLKSSEKKIDPVLAKLKDQVIYLKHNLNAQAITGLKKESVKIQSDIESLMTEMNNSMKSADEFIKTI